MRRQGVVATAEQGEAGPVGWAEPAGWAGPAGWTGLTASAGPVFVIGCVIFGASTMLLALATNFPSASGKASLLWAIAFHMGSNIGWLYFSPITSALYSRAAPKSVNATMMGVNYLSVFLGSVISGRLGGLYEKLDPAQFWTLHAAIVCAGGAVILLIGTRLRPLLNVPEQQVPRAAVA